MSMYVVKDKPGMKGLFARKPFDKNEIIFSLKGKIKNKPTRTSIKIGQNRHVEDLYGKYINHNCRPSVKIIDGNVVAIKNIKIFEEITFNYLENEDDLAAPFICECCGKDIK